MFTFIMRLVAFSVLSILTQPRQNSGLQPSTLEEFDIPNSREGRPRPVIFGTIEERECSVVGYGNYRTAAIKTKASKK